jgi:HSP20 family molecular chaperone IbpA
MNSQLIDDDFESVFRRLFESLRGSLGALPEGTTSFSYVAGSLFNDTDNEGRILSDTEPDIERIDLEDEVLFIVDIGYNDANEYSVKVEAKTLKIIHEIDGKEKLVDLDFDIDIDHSHASLRNGIVEISLKIAKKGNPGNREGYLTID